jgi:hypothetical protein
MQTQFGFNSTAPSQTTIFVELLFGAEIFTFI